MAEKKEIKRKRRIRIQRKKQIQELKKQERAHMMEMLDNNLEMLDIYKTLKKEV